MSNRFGILNDVDADDPVRIPNMQAIGVSVYRLRANVKNSPIAYSVDPALVVAAGFKINLVIKNTGSGNAASTFPASESTFKARVQEAIDTCGAANIAYVTFENEIDASKFWAGTKAEYGTMLQWGCEQVHTNPGLKATDGSFTAWKPEGLSCYQWMVDNLGLTIADAYFDRAAPNWVHKGDAPTVWADMQDWIAVITATDIDACVFHYYLDSDDPLAVADFKLYKESAFGVPLICNEAGCRSTDPAVMTDLCVAVTAADLPLWVWYSVDTDQGTVSEWETGTETLRPIGIALRDFIAGLDILPVPTPGPRRRHGLPPVHWSIDGVPVELDADWSANAVDQGGFDSLSGSLPPEARRIALQEAKVTGAIEGEQYVWEGHLTTDAVLASDGRLTIDAVGEKERADQASGRLLYQSRDYALFADGATPPFDFGVTENIEGEVRKGSLWWKVLTETYVAGNNHPLAAWAPGAFITRYAFNIRRERDYGNFVLRVDRFTGPSGARTPVNDHGLDTGNPLTIDEVIGNPEDGIAIGVRCSVNASPGQPNRIRAVDLRINGIAPIDEFDCADVARDLGQRLRYDVSRIRDTGVNGIPFDLIDGSWADSGFSYHAMLIDGCWGAWEDRGRGPLLTFGPYATTWDVTRSTDAEPDLRGLPVYSEVVVMYKDTAGADRQVVVEAKSSPLLARGVSRTWYETLTDAQPDETLALQVANSLIARLSVPRYTGSIDIIDARLQGGWGNAYAVRPGQLCRITDWGPMESLTHRITEVQYRSDGVRLGIENAVTADGVVAEYGLEQLRRKKGGKK